MKLSLRSVYVKFIAGIVFVLLVTAYMYHLSKSPKYNSDMLAYMGIVLQFKGLDARQLHDSTYAITQKTVSPAVFSDLVAINQGRVDRYNNYTYFYGYLKYFRLKPLYVFTIWLFNLAGINLVFATILPSIIFTGFLLVVFFFALQKIFHSGIAVFSISLIIMLLAPINELACLSTPDAMSSFFVFLLFLNIFFGGNKITSWLLLAACILTRIDNFTLLPFVLYYSARNKLNTRLLIKGAVIFLLSTALILVIPCLFGNNLSWVKLFIFSPGNYYQIAQRSVELMRTDFNLLFVIFLSLFYIILSNQKQFKFLFQGILLSIVFRFLLFPSYEERFYFVYKLIFIFLILSHFSLSYRNGLVNLKDRDMRFGPFAEKLKS